MPTKDYQHVIAHTVAVVACDAVIAIGGGNGTLAAGNIAMYMGKEVLAVNCFGGSAMQLFGRLQFKYRNEPEIGREKEAVLGGEWNDNLSAEKIIQFAENVRTEDHVSLIEEMPLDASVSIRINEAGQDFDWSQLRDYWKINFGGRFFDDRRVHNTFTFQWSGGDIRHLLIDLEKKEASIINGKISAANGVEVAKVFCDEEYLYEALPVLPPVVRCDRLDVGTKDIQRYAQSVDVLLVTSTDTERNAVLDVLKPWPRKDKILVGALSKCIYRLGKFGRYRSALIQTTMGDIGPHGAALTVLKAIYELQPKTVLLLESVMHF